MLLRLLIGLLLSVRMARAARPIQEGWTDGADVRTSDDVAMPVTFGSTVLLPPEYTEWSGAKRLAVLSHERAHVAHGDFYVLLLAAFNRAIFWFSPLAWWQLFRMAELAEIISDDAALEMLDDPPSYAAILLEFAGGVDEPPAAIAMARACTLRKRWSEFWRGRPCRLAWVGENARWWRLCLLRGSPQAPSCQAGVEAVSRKCGRRAARRARIACQYGRGGAAPVRSLRRLL